MSDEKITSSETDFLPDETPDAVSSENPEAYYTKKTSKKEAVRAFFESHKYLLACFLVPAALMLLIHIGMGVYPFGEESVLVLDLNGQYIFYFEALRDLLLGEGSFIYSFGRTLGGEFMGIIAYYLASPLSFIVALFPKEMMTEALLVLFVLKTGLCGLTFGVYLHKTRERNPVAAVIFSTMYALTAYAVVYQHNTMWIDNVIFLPLILLGIESIIKHGKYKLFVVTLALAVISNYYIGYMTCIFVAVYFFYYFFSRTPEERNPHGESHHFALSLGRIALFSVIALSMAAIIILPAYYSLTFGKTTFSDPSFGLTQKFDFLDMISMMYFGSYDTVRPEGLPLLYTGMLTLLLMPLYFFAPHVKTREKVATGVLILFFIVSFNASTLDLIWHGFQRPNWLNYRYSFMLCFVFIQMAFKAFEKIREIGFRYVVAAAGAVSAILLIMQKMDFDNLPDLVAVWGSLAFCVLYLFILRASVMKAEDVRHTASLIMAIVVCLEMFCAGYHNIICLDADVVVSSRDSYRSVMDRIQPVVDDVKAKDDSFYRMEKTIHRNSNDNLALGMRGLSNSTSTLNASVIEFLNRLGMTSKSHWTKYYGSTPVLDAITGIKYVIAEPDDRISALYSEFSNNGDLIVYENPYALPVAFGVDRSLGTFNLGDPLYTSPFERMNYLIGEMTGAGKQVKVFQSIRTDDIDYENCISSMVVGHKKYAPERTGDYAKVIFTITVPQTGYIYVYFPSDYPREADLIIDGNNVGTFFGNETFAIRTAGPFEAGQEIDIALKLRGDDLYLATNEPFFYYLDEALFKESMNTLSASPFVIDSYTEDSFYGTVNADSNQTLMFTSIPYDAGWVVKVDGKEVETCVLLDALMGFTLPSDGQHTISIEYRPDCVKYGTVISIAGIAVFAAICTGEILLKRRKQKRGTTDV